ncbi:MAG TPA: protein kinase [Pseudonocardiaceae bacterium]|nr:protein kinase [Pseudonocardiaceae bacterium]
MSEVGQLVAERYRLTQHIGSGAMGVVWQAHDERLHRTVALKQLLLSPSFSAADTKEATERAMREGRIAARLQHPNAVSVYDVVDDNGQPVLVMEYVPSRSLSAVLDERVTMDPLEVARIGSQIATALTAAHTAGIVHRDIKPGNVLLADDGTVKITDFGISRATGDVTVTATGMLAGTPAYLAPEVAKGENPGPPSDVFSLASTLYAAVEGYPPFGHSDNTLALLHAVAACRTIPAKQAGPLTGLLAQMLRANPEERPTMAETSRALSALAAGQAPNTGSIPRVEGPASPPRGASFEEGATTWIPRPPQPNYPSGGFPAQPARPASDQTVNLGAAGYPGTGPNPAQRPGYPQTGPNPALLRAPAEQNSLPWKKWLITAGAIIAAAVVGILVANAFVNTNPSSASPPPSLMAQPSTTSTTSPAPVVSDQSDQTSQSNQDDQGGSGQSANAAMSNLLKTYYTLLPRDPAQAWQLLSASAQQANGSYGTYQNSWQSVAATQVSGIAPAGRASMDAKVTFVRTDGQSASNEIQFDFVMQNGELRLNNATVLPGGKPIKHHDN